MKLLVFTITINKVFLYEIDCKKDNVFVIKNISINNDNNFLQQFYMYVYKNKLAFSSQCTHSRLKIYD